MYPHFIAFKNREKSLANHKADLRAKFKKTKEDYIGYGKHTSKDEYEFPKMSETEMETFRKKLQQEKSKEKMKRWLQFLGLVGLGILIIYLANKELMTFLN